MKNTELAEALFNAFAAGDDKAVRELCAPDMQAIQNHGPAMSIDSLLKFSLAFRNVVDNFRYEDAIRSATERGFVEEHSVRGTLPDGNELKLAACVVAEVDNGTITLLREYFDSAAVAGLRKMLAPG